MMHTAEQDVHDLTQKSSSILPITHFKLKINKMHSVFKMYISRATKKYQSVGEVKPKTKVLRHFQV